MRTTLIALACLAFFALSGFFAWGAAQLTLHAAALAGQSLAGGGDDTGIFRPCGEPAWEVEAGMLPVILFEEDCEYSEIDPVLDRSGIGGVQYALRSGETVEAFARHHRVDLRELSLHNDLTIPTRNPPEGLWLYVVPVHGDAFWIVRPGQTLGGIAQVVGKPVGEIARLNDIADPDFVEAGDVLWLHEEVEGWQARRGSVGSP